MPFAMALACFGMDMTFEEALVAATINGAWSLDRAEAVGSLEPGKLADAVVVDGRRHQSVCASARRRFGRSSSAATSFAATYPEPAENSPMTLTERTLVDLLAAFRSPAPTPGGGSASALAGAVGAALLAMVASDAKTPRRDGGGRRRLQGGGDTLRPNRANAWPS